MPRDQWLLGFLKLYRIEKWNGDTNSKLSMTSEWNTHILAEGDYNSPQGAIKESLLSYSACLTVGLDGNYYPHGI